MNLQKLLNASSRLLEVKNYNHSLLQAICHQLLFIDNRGSSQDSFKQFLQSQQFSPSLCDMLNVLLFNVCAQNQEMIKRYDQQLLQSTEDAQRGQKNAKITVSSIYIGKKVRKSLKSWLEQVLNSSFFAKILQQIKSKSLGNSKCLRSLLETIDYITYKYELTFTYREYITQSLSQLGKRAQNSLINDKISFVNKTIFAGGNSLVQFMNEISDNYLINLAELAEIIVINYSNTNSSRKVFESANNFGQTITEQIIDYLIRKCNKNDLFSEKMDSYRPFELLMQIIYQKFGSVLLDYHQAIFNFVKKPSSLYSSQSYKAIQYFASLFTYLIPREYPALHNLFKYTFTSLMAKYSTAESLELIKKFILNRFFLNPFFYALLYTPDPKEMERFVKIANQMRILFYEKKVQSIAGDPKNGRLVEFGQMLRNSLNHMLNDKQQAQKSEHSKDNGVYINDALLNNIVLQIYDNLKPQKNTSKISVSEAPSDSSLSFSLRNDSASRMHPHFPSNIPTITHHNSSSIPILPKPSSRTNRQENSQKNIKDISTDTLLQDKKQISTISELQDLVQMRREYGQIRRIIEARATDKKKKRQKFLRDLTLLQQPFENSKNKIRNSSSQVHINTLFL